MYDIFNLLKVETEQDKSCFQSICISLQSLYESQELFTPKDKLINFSQIILNIYHLILLYLFYNIIQIVKCAVYLIRFGEKIL